MDDGSEQVEAEIEKKEKDHRKIPRKYQLDLCKKAMEENIIVYLGTGCGKTHIAVLLIHEFGNVIRKPQNHICVFLAPTVALVQQQARVIEESTDFKVGTYCGGSKKLKSHEYWEKEIEQYEVLVMIPQILLHNLYHCFIKMDLIALLIFDECHHAQAKSNHPYAEIMKVYYKSNIVKPPRIFGMTASPVVGKDASNEANLPKSINSLENLLNAKVYSVEDKDELESFVASPVVKVYDYGPLSDDMSSSCTSYRVKLEEIKYQCISTIQKIGDHRSMRSLKRLLMRMHANILFCLENLGLWGALQASQLFLKGDHSERNELIEEEGNLGDDSLCDKYLCQAADILASDYGKDGIPSALSCVEVLKEPFFSRKLLHLIGILSNFRLQPNMKCIVFVNRIVTARSLSYILQNLKILTSWKCHYLVGVHSGDKNMSRKTMKVIVQKFRTGELNLLVATKVGEEGLDIQTCCLVIRFDLPETVASFIQSRGRARMPKSEYAFLINSGNQKELDLIKNFKNDEDRMNSEISSRTSDETFPSLQESMYKVDSSGASISAGYSISLLHHYCSKLPHDEYFDPKPHFYYFDDLGGSVCLVKLPSNAPLSQIVGKPQSSNEAAKKDACLKAIEELHKLGALSDYLLPEQDNVVEEDIVVVDTDFENFEDEGSRCQLQEMLVPATLKEPWTDEKNPVVLNCYYVKFIPNPEDRSYKEFGLFLKAPLPKEAEEMELDLHLRRRRSVMTKLVQSGVTKFNKDEIMEAQYFQEMFLKILLDRSQFISEFVPLEKDAFSTSTNSTFYLLLPVILHDHENKVTIDWTMMRRCLSSTIFKTPAEIIMNGILPSDQHLELANGCTSRTDVVNSLVYVLHKDDFCFITNIVDEKNGYSPYRDSEATSFMEHFINRFDIHLKHPEQPLLRAKPLSSIHNLLCNRKPEDTEVHELDEFFYDVPPELCFLKIIGFSKDVGSSLCLLPSIMHRLENLLVAIELKTVLCASFPEAAKVSADTVLEALTTEKCQERFSLERLEVLGDAFLKYAVGRHLFLLHGALDEGELTRKRSNAVNNSNLFMLATRRNLQAYIRDQPFDPSQFFTFGRPCPIICGKETEEKIHVPDHSLQPDQPRCSRGHHWLHKKTIADVVEALVGAFLVDSGFKAATAFLQWIGIKVDFEASQVTHVCIASKNYLPLASHVDVGVLENSLGYQFLHRGLLLQAIIHPSYNKHGGGCYQRLEFLGDAVLDYLITSYLFSVYPKLKPGQLTDLRSASVSNKVFANVSVDCSFHKFLLFDSNGLSEAIEKYVDFVSSSSPKRQSTEEPKCPKALGDLVESCLGAILLDTGFDLNRVWKIMLSLLDPIKSISNMQLNPIRELRELCQGHKFELQISPTKRGGNFSVVVKVNVEGVCLTSSAINRNKKDAFRIASQQLFGKLKSQGYELKSKTLEEVLKGGQKKEPMLIGYDEMPIDVTVPDTAAFENMKLEEPSNDLKLKTYSNRKTNSSPPNSSYISRPQSSQFEVVGRVLSPSNSLPDGNCGITSPCTDESSKGTARSRLYEICAANFWMPPLFECCVEEGPSHLRLFTYKVIMEIEEASNLMLECYGSPKSKKKAAAEDAAEGALWYLKKEGYLR